MPPPPCSNMRRRRLPPPATTTFPRRFAVVAVVCLAAAAAATEPNVAFALAFAPRVRPDGGSAPRRSRNGDGAAAGNAAARPSSSPRWAGRSSPPSSPWRPFSSPLSLSIVGTAPSAVEDSVEEEADAVVPRAESDEGGSATAAAKPKRTEEERLHPPPRLVLPPRLSVRPARPDELETVAALAVGMYGSDSEGDAALDDTTNPFEYGEKFVILWWNYWSVYLGVIERLLLKNFAEGMREGSSSKASKGTPVSKSNPAPAPSLKNAQDIYVAVETTRGGEEIVAGAVEVFSLPCPLPFGGAAAATNHGGTVNGDGKEGDGGEGEKRLAPFVCNLSVHPAYRRLGLARALLEGCEESALGLYDDDFSDGGGDKAGGGEIWLETYAHNLGALRLYRGEGWTCEGVDPEDKAPRRVFFRKLLGGPSRTTITFGEEEGMSDDVAQRRKEGEAVPPLGRDILRFVRNDRGDGWVAAFDLGEEEDTSSVVAPRPFLEEKFGALAPLVAAAGMIVGVVPFWKRRG